LVARTLSGRLEPRFQTTHLGGIELAAHELLDIRRVKILGAASTYIAGGDRRPPDRAAGAAAGACRAASRVPLNRNPVIERDTLYIAVSQSGETFDTLAAVQEVKRKGGRVLGIVNVVGSTIARECGRGIYLHAGPEIAVVSTKTLHLHRRCLRPARHPSRRIRDLSTAAGGRLLTALAILPGQIDGIIAREAEIARLAERLALCEHRYSSAAPPAMRWRWRVRSSSKR